MKPQAVARAVGAIGTGRRGSTPRDGMAAQSCIARRRVSHSKGRRTTQAPPRIPLNGRRPRRTRTRWRRGSIAAASVASKSKRSCARPRAARARPDLPRPPSPTLFDVKTIHAGGGTYLPAAARTDRCNPPSAGTTGAQPQPPPSPFLFLAPSALLVMCGPIRRGLRRRPLPPSRRRQVCRRLRRTPERRAIWRPLSPASPPSSPLSSAVPGAWGSPPSVRWRATASRASRSSAQPAAHASPKSLRHSPMPPRGTSHPPHTLPRACMPPRLS
eukprot:scaffold1964_cov252-Isochrysis_galbana.AAC.22